MDKAAESFEVIRDISNIIPGGTDRYGSLVETVGGAADLYKRVRFKLDVLPRFARMPQSLDDMFTDADMTPALLQEWRVFDFGCQMIVGGFNTAGQAFLLYIEGDGIISNIGFPGFGVIGSGLSNAMFWLSYRNQNFGLPVKTSAYHALEAKMMAESSPFVNEKLDILVATRGQWTFISDSKPVPESAAFNLNELRQMLPIYGPKSTDDFK
jgi:hypothetical protein